MKKLYYLSGTLLSIIISLIAYYVGINYIKFYDYLLSKQLITTNFINKPIESEYSGIAWAIIFFIFSWILFLTLTNKK